MMRKSSKVAEDWWDYTTLDDEILNDAARLTQNDLLKMSRPGFAIKVFDNLDLFYVSEALEYIDVWKRSTPDNPLGICGPIGPTEQLPLVAKIINDLDIDVKNGHFWAMDEWFMNGKEVSTDNPLSFTRANMNLCFNNIDKSLRMPDENLHFLSLNKLKEYSDSFNQIKCIVMQGGQGEVKHWAFNDPLRREGQYKINPPDSKEYFKLSARVVDLHPMTIIQNARTSGGGIVSNIPTQALTVGPVETLKSEKISIWHSGTHDNPYGIKLTTLMISKKIVDTSVPISLLAEHPNVQFNFFRGSIIDYNSGMH